MWRMSLCVAGILAFLGVAPRSFAQQNFVPAGTLLRCTLDEPRLSPRSADVGDPILCQVATQRIGWVAFPRGTYLGGHIEAQKKLGNFSTHGSMRLVFDRIGWPNGMVVANSKVIAVRNHTITHDGTIMGGWLGDPVLKGETPVVVRLMDDVEVPPALMSYGAGWHFFGEINRH